MNPVDPLTSAFPHLPDSGASLWPHPPRPPGANWPHPPRSPGGNWPHPPRAAGAHWPHPPQAQGTHWPHPPGQGTGQWPIEPQGAVQWPIEPNRAAPPDDALLAMALRMSRSRVLHAADADARAEAARPRTQRSPLWRWSSDSRIPTVVCEVMERFAVDERSLYLRLRGPKAAAETPLFTLPRPLKPAELDEQIDKVLRAASERDERMPEILTQATDFFVFYESLTGLVLARAPYTAELLSVAYGTTLHLVMLLKHRMAMPRPVECSSMVMPMIPTPGHGALPSGHATMAALLADLYRRLLYPGGKPGEAVARLDRLARRIAFNRVVAGVHFPVDGQVGYVLGTVIGATLAALAGQGPLPEQPDESVVLGPRLELPELPAGAEDGRLELASRSGAQPGACGTWQQLWLRAVDELAELRI
jgi:hypothetical protein